MLKPVAPVVLVGKAAPLGTRGPLSGINKRPVAGRGASTRRASKGNVQGDLNHHGDLKKTLHQHSRDRAAAWIEEMDEHPLLAAAGAFGENLSTSSWLETDVCIGAVVHFGTAPSLAVYSSVPWGRTRPEWPGASLQSSFG